MTDLTEQWEKGELPEGFYFVNDGAEVTIDYYLCDYWERHFGWDVQQVLAPVPSYDEWQASENYIDYLKQCISVYESKDKQATETSIAYNELAEENDKLKTENKWYSEQLNEAVKEIAQLKKWCEEFNALEVAKENAQLKDVLKTIKRRCELILPKNGLAPVGDRARLCRTFFDLIDEVLK